MVPCVSGWTGEGGRSRRNEVDDGHGSGETRSPRLFGVNGRGCPSTLRNGNQTTNVRDQFTLIFLVGINIVVLRRRVQSRPTHGGCVCGCVYVCTCLCSCVNLYTYGGPRARVCVRVYVSVCVRVFQYVCVSTSMV